MKISRVISITIFMCALWFKSISNLKGAAANGV